MAGSAKALAVKYDNIQSLSDHFLPNVKGGGLMVEVSDALKLDTEILMMVTLPGAQERVPVSGKVVWVTPAHNKHAVTPIIGVQFVEDRSGIFLKINNLLLGSGPRNERSALGF